MSVEVTHTHSCTHTQLLLADLDVLPPQLSLEPGSSALEHVSILVKIIFTAKRHRDGMNKIKVKKTGKE